MQPPEPQLARAFTAVPAAVTSARHCLLAFAERLGASALTCENVALAVSEAVANAVVHGYGGGPEPGMVELRASVAPGELHVVIADDGRGLAAEPDTPGLGMGLKLMDKLAQRFEVRARRSGGVEVHMTFALNPTPEGPAPDVRR
ncbi:MAG: ATP-binding protein [Solirubrobacteraceae bacterium]